MVLLMACYALLHTDKLWRSKHTLIALIDLIECIQDIRRELCWYVFARRQPACKVNVALWLQKHTLTSRAGAS